MGLFAVLAPVNHFSQNVTNKMIQTTVPAAAVLRAGAGALRVDGSRATRRPDAKKVRRRMKMRLRRKKMRVRRRQKSKMKDARLRKRRGMGGGHAERK